MELLSSISLWGIQLTSLLTILTILAVWLPRPQIWQGLYCLTLVVGFLSGSLTAWALLTLLFLLTLLWVYTRQPRYSLWAMLGLLIVGVLLGLHLLPGFNNHEYISAAQLSSDTAPFSVWFNYDKSMFAILVLGLVFHDQLIRSWPLLTRMLRELIPVMLIGLGAVYLLGMLMGYSRLDWTPSLLFIPWALKNLFFTVVAEELMFRGLVQRELALRLPAEYAGHAGVWVAAILFGAAHFAGGMQYVVLSSVAGLMYGYAYKITGKIEAAILAHFALNAGHFLFFSYPYLASSI